jgi:hypothetical protein
VTFADPTSPTSTATFPLAGQYVLWLIANDSQKFAVSSVFVSVAAPTTNLPPFVTASGPSSVNLPDPASLGGTVYDDSLPVGGTLAVQWTKRSGPGTQRVDSMIVVPVLATRRRGVLRTRPERRQGHNYRRQPCDTATHLATSPFKVSSCGLLPATVRLRRAACPHDAFS